MPRRLSKRSLLSWLGGGFVLWSCSSTHGPVPDGGAAGRGGASMAFGGSSTEGGGGGNPAAGGQGGAAATISEGGSASEAGAGWLGDGGSDSEGGMGGATGEAGEGGAAGSAESSPFDGECGHGWASPGVTAPPQLQGTVAPQADDAGNWSFTFGRYRLLVAAAHGARVTEFSIDGNNLIEPTGGSTFWPSPQQAYAWPPPAELDSAAYAAHSDGASLMLSSAVALNLGLSVNKRFWVNAVSGVVSIEYQLINQSKLSASWAPWEVTRVRAGGFTFAPRGPGNRTITQDSFQYVLPLSLLPPAPAADGIEWLKYASLKLTQDNYITEFDGAEGWLAHANRIGKSLLPVLFVKSFVDAPDASLPENQAEIQLWTSGTANPKLIEVEEQGALQVLAPGASLSWTVRWTACELPSTALLSAGDPELVALARAHAVAP